jgi:8-oxo-dGTP pyrophosphatase MutT (NUDIX family)
MSNDWEDDQNPWTDKGVTRVFENGWFGIDSHTVIRPDGDESIYSVMRPHGVAVGVLPIEDDGRVHMVGQWRFTLGRYSWEMPEGGAGRDEPALECAKRELQEETGLSAGRFEKILEMDLSNSITDERAVLFLATDLKPGNASPEPTEILRRHTAPFAEVMARVVDGRIRDAMTVAAVLRAHHMAVTGQLAKPLADAMLGREGE